MPYQYKYLNAEMPTREEVLSKLPNEASRLLMDRIAEKGVESTWERFECQQPQCRHGITGVCCQRCLWGPCQITPKRPKGICGADLNLIVAGNLLRWLAAGCSAHGTHARQVAEAIISLSKGNAAFDAKGEVRIRELATYLGVDKEDRGKQLRAIGELLLGSITGGNGGIGPLMEKYAPSDRMALWREMGIMPRSAMEEVFEALHLTTLGSCSDWRELIRQEMKTALAYCYGALAPASLGQEILFGIPEVSREPVQVNLGVMKAGAVNIIIHGHSPVLAEMIVALVKSDEVKKAVKEAGAGEIVLMGACCTGKALLSRHGIPSVTGIMGSELAFATGALDALVLDMQCAIPGLGQLAECFGGKIITTYPGNRFAGESHIPYSPEEADRQAREIIHLAIENFKGRRGREVSIPASTALAVSGWEPGSFLNQFGGAARVAELLRQGAIKGIVSVGGCDSPKVPFEFNHVELARGLISQGILVFTTGCASYALLNAGLAGPAAAELAPAGLRELCRQYGMAPVLPIGACTDNFRLLKIYEQISHAAGHKVADMPFCHSGPAPGSEKNVGQGLTFLLHGVSVHQGFPAGIPVPMPKPVEHQRYADDMEIKLNDISRFFAQEAYELLGARVYVEPYPQLAAKTIQMHLHRHRMRLKWPG